MVERFYSGEPGGRVTVRDGFTDSDGANKRPLDPRLDLSQHSLTGFSWGDDGSGSAQLALALLADALRDDPRALHFHQDFSRRVVSIFPKRWTITRSRILAHVNVMELKQLDKLQTPAKLAAIGRDAYAPNVNQRAFEMPRVDFIDGNGGGPGVRFQKPIVEKKPVT